MQTTARQSADWGTQLSATAFAIYLRERDAENIAIQPGMAEGEHAVHWTSPNTGGALLGGAA